MAIEPTNAAPVTQPSSGSVPVSLAAVFSAEFLANIPVKLFLQCFLSPGVLGEINFLLFFYLLGLVALVVFPVLACLLLENEMKKYLPLTFLI